MNVQAVGNHREMLSFDKGLETVKPVEESGRSQAVKPKDDVAPSGGEAAATGEKGVIGLLLAGHFRGVADARLRINFYEELQQRNSQAAQAAFDQAAFFLGCKNGPGTGRTMAQRATQNRCCH